MSNVGHGLLCGCDFTPLSYQRVVTREYVGTVTGDVIIPGAPWRTLPMVRGTQIPFVLPQQRSMRTPPNVTVG